MLELLRRTLGFLLGIVLLAAALVFTSIILAVAAVLAILIGAWVWWRSRALRHEVRDELRTEARADRVVIEGEYRVEEEQPRPGGRD